MIIYLTHKDIDKQKWDDCISKSFNGIVYAYSWYLDVVCEGWEALIEDDYRKVMPLTAGKKFGISYLYPPFFTQQLGVFSTDILSEETVPGFIKHIPDKFRFFEYNLNTFNKLSAAECQVKSNVNCELDLTDTYTEIFRKFADNTKRNIKKAQGKDLRVSPDVTIDELIKMFRDNRGRSIKNLKDEDYNMLKRIVERCSSRGFSKIIGVKSGQKLCAGGVFVSGKDHVRPEVSSVVSGSGKGLSVAGQKIIFLFSASNREAKGNGAMFFLIDYFIRENAQKKLALDFEGSNNPDLARFYKGFGSKECHYLQIRKNNLPWYIRWVKEIQV